MKFAPVAREGEPHFTLFARDPDAPELVRLWAAMRDRRVGQGERPSSDLNLVERAMEIAKEMETWRKLRK